MKNEIRNVLIAMAVIVVAVIAGFLIYKHHNNQVAQANAPIAVGNVIVVKTPCNKSATVDAAQVDSGVTTTMMSCIDNDSNGSTIEYDIDSYLASTATTEQNMVDTYCNQSSYTANDGSKVSWVDQQTVTYNSNQFNICAMQSKGSIFEVWGYGYNKDSLSSNSIDGYQSSTVNIKVDQGTNPSASDMWSRLKYVLSTIRYE